MREVEITKCGDNYTVANIGGVNDIKEYSYTHPLANINMQKVFLGEKLNMSSMEISFQVLGAGKKIPFSHKHKTHEEVYIVVKGKGQFIVDNEVTDIKEGSVIRVAPTGNRTWLNNSNDDLVMMVIQAINGSMNTYKINDGYCDVRNVK